MLEYRKLHFELREDLKPLVGLKHFTRRNGNALSGHLSVADGLRYIGLYGYHSLYFIVPMAGAFAALAYGMR